MALPVVIARNVAQKLGLIQNNDSDNTIGATAPATVYTCPTGKEAEIISMAIRVTGLGNGTIIQVLIGTLNFHRVTATSLVLEDSIAGGRPLMTAGQIIQITGDAAGDNAAVTWANTVRERPV